MTNLIKSAALIYIGWFLAKQSIPGSAEIDTLVAANKQLLAKLGK